MAHEVFISYSSTDKTTADAICHALEAAGIRCWIAPRDVTAGLDWDDEIAKGIDGSRIMVMVFSSQSLQSKHVKGELHRAGENEIPIIPFRIEAVEPTGGMGLILTKVHWLDALTPPLEQHLETLVQNIRKILGVVPEISKEVDTGHELQVEKEPGGRSSASLYMFFIGSLALAVLGIVFAVWQPWRSTNGEIFSAVTNGNVQQVEAFLSKGADIDSRDKEGRTLLMASSYAGQFEVVKLLLEKGADINAKDKDGDTALMLAASKGHLKVVSLLLERHADIYAKNGVGKTAFDLAAQGGFKQVVELLKGRQSVIWPPLPANDLLQRFNEIMKKSGANIETDKNMVTGSILATKDSEDGSLEYYLKRAGEGDPHAQYILANMYIKGAGVNKDPIEGLKWMLKAGDNGNIEAQLEMARRYDTGEGVQQNDADAAKWYRKAAEAGNAFGQATLGWMFANGKGVQQDYIQAVSWCRKAAEQGNSYAQSSLGYRFANGQGVTQDYAEALKWYRKAAEQGNSSAQSSLGYMFENGQGVIQDKKLAAKYYRLAAEQGNVTAQYYLGLMYEFGNSAINKDLLEARKWFSKAAEQGYQDAKARLKKLEDIKPQDGNF
jgi:hypothetical protein